MLIAEASQKNPERFAVLFLEFFGLPVKQSLRCEWKVVLNEDLSWIVYQIDLVQGANCLSNILKALILDHCCCSCREVEIKWACLWQGVILVEEVHKVSQLTDWSLIAGQILWYQLDALDCCLVVVQQHNNLLDKVSTRKETFSCENTQIVDRSVEDLRAQLQSLRLVQLVDHNVRSVTIVRWQRGISDERKGGRAFGPQLSVARS